MDEEPHKLATLEHCCKVTDVIAELEAAMKGEELVVRGSRHQPVINPLVDQIRQQRALLLTLIKSLQLPESELDEDAEKQAATTRSERGRHAAAARWGKVIR